MKDMLENRQKFLVYLIPLLILGVSLTVGFTWLLTPQYWEYDTSIQTKGIHLFGNNKQYVLAPSQVRIIQNYAYTVRFRRQVEDKDTHTIQDGEYLKVDFYDLRTKNLQKKLLTSINVI